MNQTKDLLPASNQPVLALYQGRLRVMILKGLDEWQLDGQAAPNSPSSWTYINGDTL